MHKYMDNLINSIQDTAVYVNEQEKVIDSSIKSLSENDDKLRSYLILYMLASKSKDALERMGNELPDIEKRLRGDTDHVCKQAREILDGAETRAKWIKDIMDALGGLCGNTDLQNRESELHNHMKEMEIELKSLIEIRNECPFEQLAL